MKPTRLAPKSGDDTSRVRRGDAVLRARRGDATSRTRSAEPGIRMVPPMSIAGSCSSKSETLMSEGPKSSDARRLDELPLRETMLRMVGDS